MFERENGKVKIMDYSQDYAKHNRAKFVNRLSLDVSVIAIVLFILTIYSTMLQKDFINTVYDLSTYVMKVIP